MPRLFAFLIAMLASVPASAISIGTVLNDTALRESPGGEQAGTLSAADEIQVMNGREGWYKVYAQPTGKSEAAYYWVDCRDVELPNDGRQSAYDHQYDDLTGDACTEDADSGATVCLNVEELRFGCEESLTGDGYTKCNVTYELAIESNYAGQNTLGSHSQCEATFVENGEDFSAKTVRNSTSTRFDEAGTEYTTLTITADVGGGLTPTTEVEPTDVTCEVTWARENV